MRWTWMLLVMVVATFAGAPAALAETYVVTGTADNTGICEGTTCTSIRQALASAAAHPGPDVVTVPEGDFQLQSGQLLADSDVAIVGAGARETIIRANPSAFRVLEVPAGATVAVSRVTLRDGRAHTNGSFLAGGVVRNSGALALDRVRVTGGIASSGGGIANTGGALTIDRSLIDGNAASIGGADAGGVLNFGGGDLIVRNTTIAANTAALAGAYLSWGAPAGDPNTVLFDHVTLANNVGGYRGIGGIGFDPADTVQLRASIVAGNTGNGQPSNCGGQPVNLGANVESGAECGFEQANAAGAVGAELEALGGDTDVLALPSGSPARDLVATGTQCPAADQRGVTRPIGPRCDAGAVEADAVTITAGPSGPTADATPTFEFSSAQPVDGYRCRVDDGEWASCASPWTSPGLGDGPHSFVVQAIAQGEPQAGATARRDFTVDTATPAPPTVTAPEPDGWVRANFAQLRGTAEPGATVTVYRGSEPAAAGAADGQGAWELVLDLPEGPHTLALTATDAAGNASEPASLRVNADGTEPATRIDAAPTDPTNAGRATFTYSADEPATFTCRLSGPNIDEDEHPCPAEGITYDELVNGTYTFRVRAHDRAGNSDDGAEHYVFTVNRALPDIPTVTHPEAQVSYSDGTVTFRGTGTNGSTVEAFAADSVLGAVEVVNGEWQLQFPAAPGRHDFSIYARNGAGQTAGVERTVIVGRQPAVRIVEAPSPVTRETTARFTFESSTPGAVFECTLDGGDGVPCESPAHWESLSEGEHTFSVVALANDERSEPATHTWRVDLTPPAATHVTAGEPATFSFASDEPGATYACRLDDGAFEPCASPKTYAGLATGSYTFTLRTIDAAGNATDSPARPFSVPAPVVVAQPPAPTPTPTPTPPPAATPTPQPTAGKDVVIRPLSGRVLVRLPGSNRFVELKSIDDIPLGATIDVKQGRIQLRFESEPGKVQTGVFYGGIFQIRQTRKVLDLKLTEALAACPKQGRASAAARRAKSRKLWGSGKGAFRTSGRYSAATVRGTTWLVQDTCAGTLTRVTSGVVAVRDNVRKKTVLVRAGKRYLARARR